MAMDRYGVPEIVNTDQGAQFTSEEFISTVLDSGAKLSMDGKGHGGTISLSSDSGGRSSTKKFICERIRMSAMHVII